VFVQEWCPSGADGDQKITMGAFVRDVFLEQVSGMHMTTYLLFHEQQH
jgi:hypothetical protein